MAAIVRPIQPSLELKSGKVGEVLFNLMRELGMTKIFGNVGSAEETFLQDFPSDFEYILSLQEFVAVAKHGILGICEPARFSDLERWLART